MTIQTQAMGQINIDPKQIFHFPYGLYAFEDLRSFALLDSSFPPFYWLQSLEYEELAFLLVAPYFVISDYDVHQAAQENFSSIGISGEDDEHLIVFSIVTLNDHDATVNMQGPIVLNKAQSLGRQVIVSDERWSVRHNLSELGQALEHQRTQELQGLPGANPALDGSGL